MDTIAAIAGCCGGGYSGDGGIALNAQISSPEALALDSLGNLYIADNGNNRVRKVSNVDLAGMKQLFIDNEQILVYPIPSNDLINIFIKQNYTGITLQITDVLGNIVYENKIKNTREIIYTQNWVKGVYFYTFSENQHPIKEGKIIVE
jgi:hypothetical protein